MGSIEVSKIDSVEQLGDLPKGLSFFDPLIGHEVKEALESGGETYLSKDANGVTNGLFIYDNYEGTGTIFTSSREVFDYFYKLKPPSYIFSELDVPELPKQVWNIWQLDVDKAQADYSFKHLVAIESDVAEIERFMALAQPETNKRWIGVALKNGDRCFVVKIAGRIVGIAWITIVGDVARSHGLFVARRFRRMGMMMDNYHARLLYLKARHVHTLVNEIAEDNVASASLAAKEGEKVVGKIFLYTSPGSPAAL